jgi:hypothetical protein
MRRQEAIAECKAKSDAIDYALAQYLTVEYKKDVEKQKKYNAAKSKLTFIKKSISSDSFSYNLEL